MLREATLASNDGARLDDIEPVFDGASRGAKGRVPAPITLATASHRLAWDALRASSAALDAAGESEWKRQDWAARDAEGQAAWIVLKTPCGNRDGAAALMAHLEWYLAPTTEHPGGNGPDCPAANHARLADLRLFLGDTAETSQAPILAAIEANRQAWGALVAGSKEWCEAKWEAEGGARAAAYVIGETPCGNRTGAEALREHLEGYLPALAARDLDGAAGFEGALAARLADLCMFVEDSAAVRVPPSGV